MSRIHSFDNYIYYMSDISSVSGETRCGKMNSDYELVRQIEENLVSCKILKYTDYNGEMIKAKSVGVVFPSHTWGISLAVYSFLQNLNVSRDTYVYAVVMGTNMSGNAEYTIDAKTKNLRELDRIFAKKAWGDSSHIFIRCVDYKRVSETVEEMLRQADRIENKVENILRGQLFYNLDMVMSKRIYSVREAEKVYWKKLIAGTFKNEKKEEIVPAKSRMGNVFLDENFLAGVRLCRVI